MTVPSTPSQSPRSSSPNAAKPSSPIDGLGDEQLHLAAAVAQRGEDQLALLAEQHHPAGDGDPLVGLGARLEVSPLRRAARPSVCVRSKRYGYGLVPGVAERVELVEPLGLLGRQTAADWWSGSASGSS